MANYIQQAVRRGKAEAMKIAIVHRKILEAERHFLGRQDDSCLAGRANQIVQSRIAAIWTRAAARSPTIS